MDAQELWGERGRRTGIMAVGSRKGWSHEGRGDVDPSLRRATLDEVSRLCVATYLFSSHQDELPRLPLVASGDEMDTASSRGG